MNPETSQRIDPATNLSQQNSPEDQAALSTQAGPSSIYQEVTDAAGNQIRQVAADLKDSGGEALVSARDAGSSFLREQQGKFASQIDRYTDALKAASDTFQAPESNPLVAPAQRAARQMARAADYLRNRDTMDCFSDLGDFARRKPEVVFGGLFLAGFASVRFLKASALAPRRSSLAGGQSPSLPASPQPASTFAPVTLAPQPSFKPNSLK
jgi:hypothetical protein